MRIPGAILATLLLAGCPSLDGFVGPEKDAGKQDAGDAGPTGKGFLSIADAARLCSKLQTCPNLPYSLGFSLLLPVESKTFSTCVDVLATPLPPNRFGMAQQVQALTCVMQAADCAAAGGCLPYERIASSDPRCQPVDGGSATIACSADEQSIYDCANPFVTHCDHGHFGGASCMQENSQPRCVASTSCNLSSVGACSGTIVSWCDATSMYMHKLDCAYWGASCGTDQPSGLQDCVLNGLTPFCSPPDGATCINDRVRACYGGYFGEIDCAALGGKCDPYPTAHCGWPSEVCKQTDAALNVCTGDNIELCVTGNRVTLDCTSLGLKCLPGPNGAYCG